MNSSKMYIHLFDGFTIEYGVPPVSQPVGSFDPAGSK